MLKTALLFFSLVILSCSPSKESLKTSREITTKDYVLVMPKKQDGLLVLFPCFPCDAENTKREFNITDLAVKENIAVLRLNFNQHLWLTEMEKNRLEFLLLNVVKKYDLETDKTYIGGFSSGGNVSLLLTDHLYKVHSTIQPKGVFIVDSPIDLYGLYKDAQKDIAKNYSEVAVQEAQWIVSTFNQAFGTGDSSLVNYKQASPYSIASPELFNLSHLNDVNIRLYSEPDTAWWKENRQTDYENMNAFYIEHLYKGLKEQYGKESVDYITTENKGYRSNGERHPHSWSIVDKPELLKWIKP